MARSLTAVTLSIAFSCFIKNISVIDFICLCKLIKILISGVPIMRLSNIDYLTRQQLFSLLVLTNAHSLQTTKQLSFNKLLIIGTGYQKVIDFNLKTKKATASNKTINRKRL